MYEKIKYLGLIGAINFSDYHFCKIKQFYMSKI